MDYFSESSSQSHSCMMLVGVRRSAQSGSGLCVIQIVKPIKPKKAMKISASAIFLMIVYFKCGRYSPGSFTVAEVQRQHRTLATFSSTSTSSLQPPSGAQSPHFDFSGLWFMHLSFFLTEFLGLNDIVIECYLESYRP